MSAHHPDMYYEHTNRSPNQQRHQPQLHRQTSRHFDSYAHLPSGFYQPEEQAPRFEQPPRFNDRMNATIHGNYGGGYDMGAQTWNSSAFGGNTLSHLGGTNRMKPSSRGRSALPSGWLEQPQPLQTGGPFMGLGGPVMGASPIRSDPISSETDEELIPTAIVIKNIPFAVKKEQLVGLMTDMGLPLPYAFNYHFDNGVFRGLAFANFTSPDETAMVIESMNHFELQGRKLRVEYKKMLPAAERERIEREKRERRGQLEEQHRPMVSSGLQNQPSMSSLSSHIPATSPSPVSGRGMKQGSSYFADTASQAPQNSGLDVDLNDPEALQFYSKILIFKEDPNRDVLVFPPTLSPPQRRIVHTLAHHMGLAHMSKGEAAQRSVHVFKEQPRQQRLSPPMPQIQNLQNEQRRALNRAATTDFSDVRGGENFYGLRHQNSGYLGGYQDSNNNLTAGQNLRAAKSFADLRSYTPSPVPSTASFPATLASNISRFTDYGRDTASATPTLTPTGATSISSGRDESGIINGLGNMTLGSGFGGSPNRLRGMMSWDRETPAPIGSHRNFTTTGNYEDQSRERNQGLPSRQPRGPIPERGTGFPRNRQNGHMNRGSDELSQPSSDVPAIAVE